MFKQARYIVLTLALLAFIVGGCSNQTASTSQPPATPNTLTPTPTSPTSNPIPPALAEQPSNLPDRVDVVYFHRPQRCVTCLCFEERIRYVVSTYFQNELNSGKMTFGIYNIGDSKNATIVKKYSPVSSSLFINTVKDNTDNIINIEAIWSWNCRSKKESFDQQVKGVIEQSLKSAE
jgi:hypothetical protein